MLGYSNTQDTFCRGLKPQDPLESLMLEFLLVHQICFKKAELIHSF